MSEKQLVIAMSEKQLDIVIVVFPKIIGLINDLAINLQFQLNYLWLHILDDKYQALVWCG